MKTDHLQRFWKRVNQFGQNGCWEWTGRLNRDGYGNFDHDNTYSSVHRFSWRLHNGEIPEGLQVLHRCDNRRCLNPDHLFLGTQAENIADMFSKGRQRTHKGEKNNKARLTESDVSEIKRLRRSGWEYQKIADYFKVSNGCINHILNGRHWTWVK